jgi:phage terminase Nu1 subunit (DNA packaging protein)
VQWAIRQELAKLAEAAGHEASAIDYQHERARLTRAQADREELRVRELRRELADVRLVSYAIANFGSQARAILETLPGKIKRLQPKLTASDIEQIKREIVKIQNAAADITIDWSEAPEVD